MEAECRIKKRKIECGVLLGATPTRGGGATGGVYAPFDREWARLLYFLVLADRAEPVPVRNGVKSRL